MSKDIKSVGYTVKSGEMYLTKYNSGLISWVSDAEFGRLYNGFQLIDDKDKAKNVAKQCDGEVVEVFMCNEGKVNDED